MAKIMTSPLISRISGKVGNVVFSSNRSRMYVKELPIAFRYPRSEKQNAVNAILSELSATYKLLSPDQKRLWSQAAKAHNLNEIRLKTENTVNLIKQPSRNISGYNYFISINSSLALAGLDMVISPPQSTGYPVIFDNSFCFAAIPVIHFRSASINSNYDFLRLWMKINNKRGLKYIYAIEHLEDYFDETHTAEPGTGYVDATMMFPISEIADEDDFYYTPNLALYGWGSNIQADVIHTHGQKSIPTNNLRFFYGPYGQGADGERWLNIWMGCNEDFKLDAGMYANRYGVLPHPIYATKDAGMYWFAYAVFLHAIINNISLFDNNIRHKSDLTQLGFPSSIRRMVEAGLLPTVYNYTELNKPW